MNQKGDSSDAKSGEAAGSRSAAGRSARFLLTHPSGVIQFVFYVLVAIIMLQNVEATSIDVLFWSVPAFPKLVLILASIFVGAVAWELLRRRIAR